MKEDFIYDLSGFDVTRGNNYFKFKDSPVAIPFINNTKFVELTVGPPPIPLELFRFHSYEQLQALENTNTEFLGLFLILYSVSSFPVNITTFILFSLADIIWEVSLIKKTCNDPAHSSDNSTHYGKHLY